MMGYSFGFTLFPILFSLAFLLFVIVFCSILFRSLKQWNKNNHSPRLTVPATVVAKRTNHSRHGSTTGHHHTSTSYYVTFQVQSGDRMELHLAGHEYGLIVEGDKGNLTFQGTRFLGFERT